MPADVRGPHPTPLEVNRPWVLRASSCWVRSSHRADVPKTHHTAQAHASDASDAVHAIDAPNACDAPPAANAGSCGHAVADADAEQGEQAAGHASAGERSGAAGHCHAAGGAGAPSNRHAARSGGAPSNRHTARNRHTASHCHTARNRHAANNRRTAPDAGASSAEDGRRLLGEFVVDVDHYLTDGSRRPRSPARNRPPSDGRHEGRRREAGWGRCRRPPRVLAGDTATAECQTRSWRQARTSEPRRSVSRRRR